MPFFIRLMLSMVIIVTCVQIGKRFPTLGGLIATMPLTSLIVLLWLYSEGTERGVLMEYTRGVLWGIVPTILFFAAALYLLGRGSSFGWVVAGSFGVWIVAAVVHQLLLR